MVSLARRRRQAQRHSSRLVGSLATLCALAMGAWRRVLCSGALEPRVATVLAVLTCAACLCAGAATRRVDVDELVDVDGNPTALTATSRKGVRAAHEA